MNRKTQSIRCEICIIGSGAGGATAAACLTDLGYDVLVLEEGGQHNENTVPSSATSSMLKMWRNAGISPLIGRIPIALAEGKCVGGSTEINSAIFQRTPKEIEFEWSKKIDDFTFGDLDAGYEWAEKIVNASMPIIPDGQSSIILKNVAEKKGWKYLKLKRGQRKCVGTNLCSFGCPTGGKQSMSQTLLPKSLLNGAKLISNAKAEKLHCSNGKVNELVARLTKNNSSETKRIKIVADYYFIACGTIQTAHLLQKSLLKSHGSSNFQVHPSLKLFCKFDRKVRASESVLPLYAITEFMPNYRMGGSVTTPGTFGMSLAESWSERKHLLHEFDYMATYYSMIRPMGWGKIRNIPGFNSAFTSYSLAKSDVIKIEEATKKFAEALFDVGALEIFPSIKGHKGWKCAEEIENEAFEPLKFNLMSIHSFSSCSPLNQKNENDSFGRIKSVNNLFVCDASLMPSASCVNPQATVMAFAKRAVEKFDEIRGKL